MLLGCCLEATLVFENTPRLQRDFEYTRPVSPVASANEILLQVRRKWNDESSMIGGMMRSFAARLHYRRATSG